MPRRIGDKIARLIGAAAGEVAVADSTSVNLFKLLAAALPHRPGRRVILSERDNFPTDLYIAQGVAALFVGIVEAFSSFYASNYKEVIVFMLLIPVLLLRSLAAPVVEEEKD